jgi:hypothetical protein
MLQEHFASNRHFRAAGHSQIWKQSKYQHDLVSVTFSNGTASFFIESSNLSKAAANCIRYNSIIRERRDHYCGSGDCSTLMAMHAAFGVVFRKIAIIIDSKSKTRLKRSERNQRSFEALRAAILDLSEFDVNFHQSQSKSSRHDC